MQASQAVALATLPQRWLKAFVHFQGTGASTFKHLPLSLPDTIALEVKFSLDLSQKAEKQCPLYAIALLPQDPKCM